jgi:FAD/FMN-containing dehydrogenase
MQSHETHASFSPRGCNFTIETSAVTVGGGSQLGALYEELDKINQTIVGGNSKSVSVGGYITGGGHSILAPRYGMGADQVLELEVVTPKGDIVIANECQNEDLFWAMRGVSQVQTTLHSFVTAKLMVFAGRWFYLWRHDFRDTSYAPNTKISRGSNWDLQS